jgi:phosphoribosylformylglycinamidine (FGAM) synthase PurS component
MGREDNTNKLYNATSLKRPISKLAHMMAKISLKFNFLVFEFIELYKFHLVRLARNYYQNYSIVELSARTGLDRRYISETLKNENLKNTPSKIVLVLDQIRKTCINNHTKFIAKHGNEFSFDGICQRISSSSLTSNSIAKELIRRGEIIDYKTEFKIVNLIDTPTEKSLIYLHEHRKIISEIKKLCNLNKTKYINKIGDVDSFENIYKVNNSGLFSLEKMAAELISKGFIVDCGDKYKLIEWIYLANHNNSEEHIEMLSEEICRLANTIIHNFNTTKSESKFYQRSIFSTKFDPEKREELNNELIEILHNSNDDVKELMDSFENNQQLNSKTNLPFGVCIFVFNDLPEEAED